MADASTSSAQAAQSDVPATLRVNGPPLPQTAPEPTIANGTTTNNTPQHSTLPRIPPYIATILPSGPYPLSGTALRAHLLGLILGLSSSLSLYLASQQNPLWRPPFFTATLCLFHFLEFYITAAYNTPLAKIDAFLLSTNGVSYNAAHTLALFETCLAQYFGWYEGSLPAWMTPGSIGVGLGMIVVGQVVRSVAMAHAGTNFNHQVQNKRNAGHELVTGGVYAWLRHPSYFGFFWWALGTQVVLGNKLCLVGYAAVLWSFFKMRIHDEERHLITFFGEEYVQYKKRTGVGIPFIS